MLLRADMDSLRYPPCNTTTTSTTHSTEHAMAMWLLLCLVAPDGKSPQDSCNGPLSIDAHLGKGVTRLPEHATTL